jgi:AraC-like DNA-binding protein
LGKIATRILAAGEGWQVGDVICSLGPQDRPFEEQHDSIAIAVVVSGSFQYRSAHGSELMSAGSLLLNNSGQSFECRHEHGTGDRCVSFEYAPEIFDQEGLAETFPVHRIPPGASLAPWVVEAMLGIVAPEKVAFEELACGIASAALSLARHGGKTNHVPTAADERRIAATLRFLEANLGDDLPLTMLSSITGMSRFHFLRVFKQITRLTPHQYVLRARLREAAFELKANSKPVVEIAADVGFGDLSNFNHAFRNEFGVSPRKFRGR